MNNILILYAYAADRTPFPTYVCLPSGLYKARTGQVVAQTGPEQEILSLLGIYFFDGWRVHTYIANPRPPATRERGATREALLSEAGFEKVFRTQNWVR